MNEKTKNRSEQPSNYTFNIGDSVKTEAQGLTYQGKVIDRRPYDDGGNEYLVDFSSYAQGKTWVVEWRLEALQV